MLHERHLGEWASSTEFYINLKDGLIQIEGSPLRITHTVLYAIMLVPRRPASFDNVIEARHWASVIVVDQSQIWNGHCREPSAMVAVLGSQ